MPVLIIAGVLSGQAKRIESDVRSMKNDAWAIQYVVSRGSVPAIRDVNEICKVASGSTESHILGVSKQEGRARRAIAAEIRQFFRFRWLNNAALSWIGRSPGFAEELQRIIAEESQWSELIKPKSLCDALVLPRASFQCHPDLAGLWQLSEACNDDNNINSAIKLRSAFERRYRKSMGGTVQRWVDKDGLVYDHTGQRHGVAPFPYNWKYSYCLESGFHYDVSHIKQESFCLVDSKGERYSRGRGPRQYVNLDSHGRVVSDHP
ncbi:MAG: hypothetical protein HQL80_13455 [Magnetococcales bacterium]|nr:hypothetical protein [Magnetococcales bacterium]